MSFETSRHVLYTRFPAQRVHHVSITTLKITNRTLSCPARQPYTLEFSVPSDAINLSGRLFFGAQNFVQPLTIAIPATLVFPRQETVSNYRRKYFPAFVPLLINFCQPPSFLLVRSGDLWVYAVLKAKVVPKSAVFAQLCVAYCLCYLTLFLSKRLISFLDLLGSILPS